jgi:alpha-glucosidase
MRRALIMLLLGLGLCGQAGAQSITITWDAPALQPGQTIVGYQLARCILPVNATGCTCTPTLLAGAITTVTSMTDTPPSGHYCYSAVTLGLVQGQSAISALGTPFLVVSIGTPPSAAPVALHATAVVPSSALTVSADSQETLAEQGEASRAHDGLPTTFWHTQYTPTVIPLPHWFQLDLPGTWWISGLRYLPRQDAGVNGTIADYRIEVLDTSGSWQEVARGTWPSAGLEWREVRWPVMLAQAVRLWAIREVNRRPWTSASEVQLLQ